VSLVEQVVGLPYRIRFRWRNRGRQALQANTLASLRGLFEGVAALNLQNSRTIHNVALYALLLDQDLFEFNRDMVMATSNRRRGFVARHLAVLLYEGTHDLPELLGRDYRESLQNVRVPAELIEELNEVSSAFNRFKDQHQTTLSAIRNAVAAHREHDVKLQLNLLDSIKPIAILKLAADFSAPLNKLVALQTKLTVHLGELGVLVRELMMPRASRGSHKSRRNRG
jgi:hypothetical protein